MAMRYMLTTLDNPFDPFEEFDEWNSFDESKGYYTNGMLARIVITSDQLSETDRDRAVEMAIDEIIQENVLGIYRKVGQEV